MKLGYTSCFVPAMTGFTMAFAYDVPARWAHISVLVSSPSPNLIIHGGKTDSSLSYTYSSAPNSADLLTLDLAHDFTTVDRANIPWKLIPGVVVIDTDDTDASNTSVAYAWSVAGVVDNSSGTVALFGGDGGPSLAIQTNNDSTWSLQLGPSSSSLPAASLTHSTDVLQPIRKTYSSAATHNGQVFVTGGERADGSELGYDTVYCLSSDRSALVYSQLPSLPATLVHHASIILANGTLIVIGGWIASSDQYLAFSQAYALDTASPTAKWRRIDLSPSSRDGVPVQRRGHTVTFVESIGTAILFGGVTGGLQGNPLNDIWELELSTAQWTKVVSPSSSTKRGTAAMQPGPRWDHTAVAAGDQILVFGGYGAAGPADANLYIYDAISHSWTSLFSNSRMQTTLDTGPSTASITGTASPKIATDSNSITVTLQDSLTATAITATQVAPNPTHVSNAIQQDNVKITRAIAIGSSMAGLVLIALAGGLGYAHRKRCRRIFTCCTGRTKPRRRSHRPYKDGGEGSEGLIVQDDASGTCPLGTEKHALQPLLVKQGDQLAFSAIQPLSPQHRQSGVVKRDLIGPRAGEVFRVNNMEKRFDMLLDEDRSDLEWTATSGAGWQAAVNNDVNEADLGVHQGLETVEGDFGTLSQSVNLTESRHSFPGSASGSDSSTNDRPLDSLQGVCASQDHGSRNSIYESHHPAVNSYVDDGKSFAFLSPPNSGRNVSGLSRGSFGTTNTATSQLQATLLVARKDSLHHADATYLPPRRGNSLLKRLTTNGFGNLFSKSADFDSQLHLRDPSTPPKLLPLQVPSIVPSAWRPADIACVPAFARSVSSFATVHTADSEALASYDLMNVARRQRDASSTTENSIKLVNSRETSPTVTSIASPTPQEAFAPVSPDTSSKPGGSWMPSPTSSRLLPEKGPRGVPDRSVKDIAASINKRSTMADWASPVTSPSLREAAAVPHQEERSLPSTLHDIRSPQGLHPKTRYQLKAREQLTIANA